MEAQVASSAATGVPDRDPLSPYIFVLAMDFFCSLCWESRAHQNIYIQFLIRLAAIIQLPLSVCRELELIEANFLQKGRMHVCIELGCFVFV